jgi:phosphoglycolate phosphatase-like HAD superfamily hydrolase
LSRLDQRIDSRRERIRSGAVSADDFLLHGSRSFLEEMQQRGMKLYLASGTDESFVLEEARLLNIAKYFGERIYGAKDDYKTFSKKMVINRILRENAIPGERLLAFGDGYVEIENTKQAGGLAVAVASDEARNGSGQIDAWKRERLLGVGADVVIPDFRDGSALMEIILGEALAEGDA